MGHVLEAASSGRSKCRGCGERIEKGALRFGERVPNPFAEGETTWWFHPLCAAFKRPEPFLELMESSEAPVEELVQEAKQGLEHRRLPRVDGAERASTGRASCRSCREPIAKGTWRIRLVYYQDGRFDPGGFIHVRCAGAHFGTTDLVPRLRRFSASLSDADLMEIATELGEGRASLSSS